jgi:ribosomal protein S18 acetylase RimI-like enzyme
MFDTATVNEIAERLARIQFLLYERRPGKAVVDRSVAGVRMNVDPAGVTPYPSSNVNGAEPLPGGAGWRTELPGIVRKHYADAGVEKFFFWVSPGLTAEQIEADLVADGYKRFPWVQYLVLARKTAVLTAATGLSIRRFERRRDGAAFEDYPQADIRRSMLVREHHADEEFFVAWDGGKPVGVGALIVGVGIGYLWGAATLETHRGMGAQSALIAARVSRLAELGCEWAVSETNTVAEISLRNLERMGFEIVFEKKVFDPG